MIVIPAIDLRGGRVVRLRRGRRQEERAYSTEPVEVASTFAADGASLLHVVDLDAAFDEGSNRDLIRVIVEAVPARVQLGGGIRSIEAVDEALETEVARVVVSTEAIGDPDFLAAAVARHQDRIVVALDVDGEEVKVRGWTESAGIIDEVLPRLQDAGAPRFLVTQIARDGMLHGPDLALYERLVKTTDRPVIASGGVRGAPDVRRLAGTGVEGVVIGRALYEGHLSLSQALEAAE